MCLSKMTLYEIMLYCWQYSIRRSDDEDDKIFEMFSICLSLNEL